MPICVRTIWTFSKIAISRCVRVSEETTYLPETNNSGVNGWRESVETSFWQEGITEEEKKVAPSHNLLLLLFNTNALYSRIYRWFSRSFYRAWDDVTLRPEIFRKALTPEDRKNQIYKISAAESTRTGYTGRLSCVSLQLSFSPSSLISNRFS